MTRAVSTLQGKLSTFFVDEQDLWTMDLITSKALSYLLKLYA